MNPFIPKTLPEQYFAEISAIARLSEYEKNISDYLVETAKRLCLPYVQDELGNVVIRKPASPGFEDRPPVMLQAHQDMVGVRNPKVEHDFTKDPLTLLVDDENNLRADGTTLGADDGYGVAYILSVLTEDIPHPPIEAVFTVQEENGCYGAAALDCTQLNSQRMIGLDVLGDPENGLCVGCYTSDRMILEKNFESEPVAPSVPLLTLELTGVQPNENGFPVHPEEANAIKITARLLCRLAEENIFFRLSSMQGGFAENYVPVSCRALLSCADTDAAERILQEELCLIEKELEDGKQELSLKIAAVKPETAAEILLLSEKDSLELAELIYLLPGGTIEISPKDRRLLATNNIGIIDFRNGRFSLTMSDRAFSDSCKGGVLKRVKLLARLYGYRLTTELRYAPFEYHPYSEILRITKQLMTEFYGSEPAETVCPGGLEACDFLPKMPDLDIVMFAPRGGECHTTAEWMNLDSFNKVYYFLKMLLERL